MIAIVGENGSGKSNLGICGLCKQEKNLRNSHLLPRAIYKRLCGAFPKEPPGQVGYLNTENKYLMLGHQITKFYLCADCEAILAGEGENNVIKELYFDNGTMSKFPLRDKLNSVRGEFSSDNNLTEWFFQDNLGTINIQAYLHFILGIFWRASSTDWNNGAWQKEYRNALGDKYEEQIRQYLITKDPGYLEKIKITVYVDTCQAPIFWASAPKYYRKNGMNFHDLLLPGISIHATVGGKNFYKEGCRGICANQHLIFAKCKLQEGKFFNDICHRFYLAEKTIPNCNVPASTAGCREL